MTLLSERTGTTPAETAAAKSRIAGGTWFIGTLLSVCVALVSYRYVAHVGPVAPTIATNRFAQPWIVIHAAGAGTALLLGPFQFLPALRRRWPGVHRWTGRAYLAGCLSGGASGIALAAGTSAGPIAQSGFSAVGLLWIYVTARGWNAAGAGRFPEHRRWMIRSFALTFAAVTLRIYLPICIASGLSFAGAYQVIAWLSWVPNAATAELYLMLTRKSFAWRPRRTCPIADNPKRARVPGCT